MSSPTDYCLICEIPSCGYHLSINSCRSCSTFYKRTILGNKKYICRRNSKDCPIHYSIKQKCKYCRFQKCKKLGMVLRNFSKGCSNSSDSEAECNNIDQSNVSYLSLSKVNNSIESYVSQCRFDSNTNLIIKNVVSTLEGSQLEIPKQPGIIYNPFQYISFGVNFYLKKINENLSYKNINITKSIKFSNYVIFSEHCCCILSKSLMFGPEYASLSRNDKIILFKNIYPLINCLERSYTSINYFGNSFKTNLILFDNTQAFEDEFDQYSDIKLSENNNIQSLNLFKSLNKQLVNGIYHPMKELNLDEYEFSYLIGFALWSINCLPNISEEALRISKKILKSLNDDLHNYYSFTKKLENYANRVSQIISIIGSAVNFCEMKKEIILTGKIFNFFDICKFIEEIMGKDPSSCCELLDNFK
uniref:Nuclear receptor n=1 Tax=Parastrongyloides trichosuri TaxID=131310 RepID=A0A0N4ZSU8_PARTI